MLRAELQWGHTGWRVMTWMKVLIADAVVDWGTHLVVSDADVAWMRDPLPLFDEPPRAWELLFSHDGAHHASFHR